MKEQDHYNKYLKAIEDTPCAKLAILSHNIEWAQIYGKYKEGNPYSILDSLLLSKDKIAKHLILYFEITDAFYFKLSEHANKKVTNYNGLNIVSIGESFVM